MRLPSGKLTGSLTKEAFSRLNYKDLILIAKVSNYRVFVFGGRAKERGLGEGKASELARKMLLKGNYN